MTPAGYRAPSPRDDYEIRDGSWARFAHHKHAELVGLVVWVTRLQGGKRACHYGSLYGVIFHDDADLVPVPHASDLLTSQPRQE